MTKNKILVSSLWAVLEKWSSRIFSLVTFIILARLLEADDFGVIAITRLLLDYLELFVAQGFGYAIIQKKGLNSEDINSVFWFCLIVASLLAWGIFVYSEIIAVLVGYPEIADLIKWMSVGLVISALTRIQVALLTRDMKFKELMLRGMVITFGGGVIGITLALNGYGVWSLVAQQIGGATLGVIVLWYSSRWRPKIYFSFIALKRIYGYSIKIFLNQQVKFISQRLDEALIVSLLGVNQLGYYSIAKKLFFLINDLILSVISKIAFSVMAQRQNDKVYLKRGLIKYTKIITILIIPIFLSASLLAPELITLAFGDKWLPASGAFSVLILSGVFLITPNLIHNLYNAMNYPELTLKLNFFRAILSVVFLPYGAQWGVIGVSLAIVFNHFIGSLIDCVFLKRLLSVDTVHYYNIIVRAIILFIPAGICAYVSISWLRGLFVENYYVVGLVSTLVIVFYAITIWFLQNKLCQNFLVTLNIKKETVKHDIN